MDFFADFAPTQTISVDPPGGTGGPHHPHPTGHFPLPAPTGSFPSPVHHHLMAHKLGHVALWVFFALFTAGLVGVGILALRVEKRARVFHWLSAAVLTIAMVSYLAMATHSGFTFVHIHHQARGGQVHFLRAVYWARYLDWLLTTPLLLVSLGVLAGLSPADTLLAVLADIFMIVTGAISALKPSAWNGQARAKWAWYAVSCVAFLVVWITLFMGARKAASLRPRKTKGLFWLLAAMTFILWTAYPVVFALTEGANKISVNAEIICYGVLDVTSKLGFTYILLLLHTHGEDDTWTLPAWFVEHRLGLAGDGRTGYGAIRVEED